MDYYEWNVTHEICPLPNHFLPTPIRVWTTHNCRTKKIFPLHKLGVRVVYDH